MKHLITCLSCLVLLCGGADLARANILPPGAGQMLARTYGVRVILRQSSTKDDDLPVPVSQPLPEYPIAMRKASVGGAVKVRMKIVRADLPPEILLIKPTDPEFGEAVKVAVKNWRFEPSVGRDNKPVEATLDYWIVFSQDLTDSFYPKIRS